MARKSTFGSVRKLASGRWQARYTNPDDGKIYNAPHTFEKKGTAQAWLATTQTDILRGEWEPTAARKQRTTFGDYAEKWLPARELRPRSRAHYRTILDRFLVPEFGKTALTDIQPDGVRGWYGKMGDGTPTYRAHAYGLLRTILGTAVEDRLIDVNPCHVRGGGSAKRKVQIEPATLAQLEALTLAMPAKYRAMILLASWCALRFGELTELRRKDIDLKDGTIRVRRGVARVNGKPVVGPPKSGAGKRDVAIPPHLLPLLREHVLAHAGPGTEGLLFPAADRVSHLAPSTLYKSYYPARVSAGRPDLRFHDLRHTGAVLAASTGATLPELMGRLGHSSPAAAMRYQHAARDRDRAIAAALSELVATGN